MRRSASSLLRASVRAAMSASVPTDGWEMVVGIGRFFREAIELMTAWERDEGGEGGGGECAHCDK